MQDFTHMYVRRAKNVEITLIYRGNLNILFSTSIYHFSS